MVKTVKTAGQRIENFKYCVQPLANQSGKSKKDTCIKYAFLKIKQTGSKSLFAGNGQSTLMYSTCRYANFFAHFCIFMTTFTACYCSFSLIRAFFLIYLA